MKKRRAKPARSYDVVKPFSTFEHEPAPDQVCPSSIEEPLLKLAERFDLPEPYVPTMWGPRSCLTLAWLIPVTSPVSVFVKAQKAFRKAVQDGISLPWYVETPGRPLRIARVVTPPSMRDEMRHGAYVERLRRVGNSLENPPKRTPGAKKKLTDAALRASLQRDGNLSANVRARLLKREQGLESLTKSTVIRRIKALKIQG